jgi:hypothetical protein
MASVSNIGMADDISLLLIPRDIITQVHKFLHQFPALVTCTSYRLVFRSGDNDQRFLGLGVRTLAVLLFDALGWFDWNCGTR